MVGGECLLEANSTGKPRSRRRTYKPPPTLDVPDIDENAPERKRILNVLAQRRYSQYYFVRYTPEGNGRLTYMRVVGEKSRLRRQKGKSKEEKQEGEWSARNETLSDRERKRDSDAEVISASSQSPATGSLGEMDFGLAGWAACLFNSNNNNAITSSLYPDIEKISSFSTATITDEGSGEEGFIFSNDESLVGNLTGMLPPNLGPPQTWDSTSASSSDGSFADSYLLPVHELTLLRATMRIAQRIGCKEQIWNLEALSPFCQGIATPGEQLPIAWKPTASQTLIPHHPMLDVLPWPGVRDRVITIFSLPDAMRPPNAMGPLALINLAYDFEDGAEGVRIYGGDPYDANSWEVGQVLFERWWFIFDRHVIENSNRWRRLRGAPPLALKGTSC
ncbi:hypothetical protein ACHAQJ_005350 [Trichoderma viride]